MNISGGIFFKIWCVWSFAFRFRSFCERGKKKSKYFHKLQRRCYMFDYDVLNMGDKVAVMGVVVEAVGATTVVMGVGTVAGVAVGVGVVVTDGVVMGVAGVVVMDGGAVMVGVPVTASGVPTRFVIGVVVEPLTVCNSALGFCRRACFDSATSRPLFNVVPAIVTTCAVFRIQYNHMVNPKNQRIMILITMILNIIVYFLLFHTCNLKSILSGSSCSVCHGCQMFSTLCCIDFASRSVGYGAASMTHPRDYPSVSHP